MTLSIKELEDLIDSAINDFEIAKLLIHLEPVMFKGKNFVHTVLEDGYEKVQKIALEFCADEN